MLVFGTVIHQEQEAGGRQTVHQAIQKRLGLGVDPVQILHDQEHGLHLALPHQQALEGVQGELAALRRVEGLPGWILNR